MQKLVQVSDWPAEKISSRRDRMRRSHQGSSCSSSRNMCTRKIELEGYGSVVSFRRTHVVFDTYLQISFGVVLRFQSPR